MDHSLFELLRRLDNSRIHYSISRHRNDSILISATFVGERVEIDFFEDGHMEVSRFRGDESIEGDSSLIFSLIDADSQQNKTEQGAAANP